MHHPTPTPHSLPTHAAQNARYLPHARLLRETTYMHERHPFQPAPLSLSALSLFFFISTSLSSIQYSLPHSLFNQSHSRPGSNSQFIVSKPITRTSPLFANATLLPILSYCFNIIIRIFAPLYAFATAVALSGFQFTLSVYSAISTPPLSIVLSPSSCRNTCCMYNSPAQV